MKKRWVSLKNLMISIPYAWLLVFYLLPFLIVLKISFSEVAISIPPYSDLITLKDNTLELVVNFGNYLLILEDALYLKAYLNSIVIALCSTFLCLLIGYPMAYAIANTSKKSQFLFLMLIIMPSWTSYLIRIYAWIGLLNDNGVINNALIWLGFLDKPLKMLNTKFSVYIGMVYAYLPFMVLSLYANLSKHDRTLLEAAEDLGAKPWKRFLTITLPLSKNGIIAGSLLVFIPCIGEFVIPELLGGSNTLMIGNILWKEFFNNRDWPMASAIAVTMLVSLIIPIMFLQRYHNKSIQKASM